MTLGLFVGACDVTTLDPRVAQPLGLAPLDIGKLSVLFSEPEDPLPDPPGGVKDPPGTS